MKRRTLLASGLLVATLLGCHHGGTADDPMSLGACDRAATPSVMSAWVDCDSYTISQLDDEPGFASLTNETAESLWLFSDCGCVGLWFERLLEDGSWQRGPGPICPGCVDPGWIEVAPGASLTWEINDWAVETPGTWRMRMRDVGSDCDFPGDPMDADYTACATLEEFVSEPFETN